MIGRVFQTLFDPRFFFRPDILVRAVFRKLRPRPSRVLVKTVWGDTFDLNPHKMIGAHVYMRGVHELAVCETLSRLTEPGELVVDVGANIGVMSSLLSRLTGPTGKVISCEAHPAIVEELRQNIKLWNRHNIKVLHAAISSETGRLLIQDSPDAHLNEGTARVRTAEGSAAASADGCFTVSATTLDEVVGSNKLGVLKVDVEGHEAEVFKGAQRLLGERRIRDIVFESPIHYPCAAHQCLLDHGYAIFRIRSSMFAPCVVPADFNAAHGTGLTDFVATTDVARLQRRMAARGWQVLKLA